MVNINWGLAQNGGMNALSMFQQAAQMGHHARQQQRERETDTALAGYAANPDDPNALNALMKVDPRLGMQMRGQQQQQQAQQAKAAEQAQAARDEYIANAAYDIVRLPEAQRPQAWDSYIQQGASRFPELQQYQGQYSNERLNAIVAKAGQMPQFQKYQQPDYVPVGEGGLSGFQYGVPIMQGQQAQDFGAPGQPAPQAAQTSQARIIPDRPANMTNDQLWAQAHEAVRNGANADDVFRQLQAWGVNP